MATKCLAEFRSTSKAAEESRESRLALRRGDDKPRSLYLRTGEQASAMAEFIRPSSHERPNTAAALELFGQIDSVILMASEEGFTMRNLQHASRFSAWLTKQCSLWTNTMLPARLTNVWPRGVENLPCHRWPFDRMAWLEGSTAQHTFVDLPDGGFPECADYRGPLRADWQP